MSLKYDYNFHIFTNEDDISYYLLGAFITDGCIYKNNPTTHACQLSSCDKDWLDNIKNIIGTNLKLHQFKENYWGIRITRNNIAQWFINHGCLPRKTYDIVLPTVPEKYFPDFLRGCVDGDGSLGTYTYNNKTTRRCQLISASLEFLQQIQEKLSRLDVKSHIQNRGKQNSTLGDKSIIARTNSYSLNINSRHCYNLLKYCYYDNHKLSLNRKYLKAKEIIDYYNDSSQIKKRALNMGCKISWPEDEELIKLINNSNIEKMGDVLGVHPSSIRNRLKRRNLYDRIIKYQKIILPQTNEELIELLKINSKLQISKQLNIGYKTFCKKIKERGIIE